MYINRGDCNFFEYGRLVDSEHSDTEFQILYCMPYSDEEDLYQFCHLTVDITDGWLVDKKKEVMAYSGMTEETFDPVLFALDCVEYFGPENFGALDCFAKYDWSRMNKAAICEELRGYLIASDNLNIEW